MQGLSNLGFTCAINSLVQIICRNDLLRNIILSYDFPDNTLISNLKELLVLLHIENKSIIPKKFVASIYNNFGNIFNYGEQIDITELWIFLNQKIISEINDNPKYHNALLNENRVLNGIQYSNYEDFILAFKNSKYLNEQFIYYYTTHCNNKISLWQNTTQGFLLNVTKCKKCDNTLYNFEPISTLHLDIPDDIDNPNIINMLEDLLQENNYNDDWKCDKCNEKTEYIKASKLWSLPAVLFIIINRFVNTNIKNTKPVNINETLCFTKGTILYNKEQEKNYKLSSIALHVGNISSGHYTSICSTQVDDKNTFLLYNDDNISKVDNFLQKNKEAYMLIYNLVQ
jgi:ubiquitin C-terminal hydrolase